MLVVGLEHLPQGRAEFLEGGGLRLEDIAAAVEQDVWRAVVGQRVDLVLGGDGDHFVVVLVPLVAVVGQSEVVAGVESRARVDDAGVQVVLRAALVVALGGQGDGHVVMHVVH